MPTRRLTLASLAAAAVLTAALAGCATSPGAEEPQSDGPSDILGVEMDIEAAWLDGGRQIAILTEGSSSCAPLAGEVELRDDGVLQVELVDPETEVCTADLAPRLTLAGVPTGVSPEDGIDVHVTFRDDGFGDTELAPYAAGEVAEYTPSAGWLGDGMFALLTWGSSTCVPVVESATGAGSEVTVVLTEPAATRPCTMDMSPRATVVTVPGVEASDDMTAILTGGGPEFAEPVTIPIAG